MNPQAVKDLLGRIRPNTNYSSTLYRTVNEASRIGYTIEETRAAVAKDKNLSETGRRSKIAEVSKSLLRELTEANKWPRHVQAQVRARRSDFKAKPLEREDAVGAARHAEIRGYLRKLPPGERMGMAIDLALDSDALEAVLGAPPALSGFGGNAKPQYDELRKLYTNRHFGEQAAEVEAMEEDATAAAGVVQLAMLDLRAASGLSEHEFGNLAKQYETEMDARYK